MANIKATQGPAKTSEWYTPRKYVDMVVTVMGAIDLDPAAPENHKQPVPAHFHMSKKHNGLAQDWGLSGDPYGTARVYLNPPYGRGIEAWVEKLCLAYMQDHIGEAIALLPARTDTGWFVYAWQAQALCFVTGRIKFDSPAGLGTVSAPFPSVFAYYGPSPERFRHVFYPIGRVIYPKGVLPDAPALGVSPALAGY